MRVIQKLGSPAGITVLLVLLIVVSMGQVPGPAQAVGYGQAFLRTQGIWVVDANGNDVLLRGANYPGYTECDLYQNRILLHDEATYREFARLGFNVVRLQISWAMLEPRPGVFDLSYLTNYVDKDVQWAKMYGLHVVLDMHQYYWAQRFKLPTPGHSGGCGVPNWAVDQYSSSKAGMIQFVSNFWTNGTLQGHLSDLWTRIARTYANESTIAGYDVLNEPTVYTSVIPYLNGTYVNRFYSMLVKSIRSVDSNHIIFLEPANMFSNIKFKGNIVWSPHFYLLSFNRTYSSKSGETLLDEELAAMYKMFVLDSGTPMWIGEFSAFMKDGTYQSYLQDAQKLFDKYWLGWAWWGFKAEFSEKVPNVLSSPLLFVYFPQIAVVNVGGCVTGPESGVKHFGQRPFNFTWNESLSTYSC